MTNSTLQQSKLAKDSPKVFRLISELLNHEDTEKVLFHYEYVMSFGHITEAPIKRAPGSSFNPRPARVSQLLISEGQESCRENISAAMLLSLPYNELLVIQQVSEKPNKLSLESLFKATQVSAISCSKIEIDSIDPHTFDSSLERLLAAYSLDKIRHLHMYDTTTEEMIAEFSFIKSIILPRITSQSGNLRLLLETALRLYSRRLPQK